MEYREFGRTGMRLSVIGTGGLLAHYWEGESGHPPPEEKRRIYLRAAEAGINLFDMGYGDEIHIPEELKGNTDERHFSLKVGAPAAADLESIIDKHLVNLRRDAIDILRVHYYAYMKDVQLRKRIADLKQMGKVRSLCTIRHFEEDQDAYVTRGPEKGADADLVIYNYVCRGQAAGIRASSKAGKGVLVMKALGGQYLSWGHKTGTDWTKATEETLVQLSPLGESMRSELSLVYSFTAGPWSELAESREDISPTGKALSWVLENQGVCTALVAVASVAELEAVLEGV